MLPFLLAACVHAPSPVGVPLGGELAPVAFLAGTWVAGDPHGTTTETWSTPANGMMFGHNQAVDLTGQTVFFEQLVVYRGGGRVVYRAAPRGGEGVEFVLGGHGPGWAEFTNPAHDYPRRLRYERVGAELVATIDDGAGGRVVSWRYRPG